MDKRTSLRVPLEVSVALDHPPLGLVGRGLTREMSLSGMFVATGPVMLEPGNELCVAFALQQDGDKQIYHIPALVIRGSTGGAGLQFRELDAATQASLQRYLYDDAINARGARRAGRRPPAV